MTQLFPAIRARLEQVTNNVLANSDSYFIGIHQADFNELISNSEKLLACLDEAVEALESIAGKGVTDLEAKIKRAGKPALISLIDTDTLIARQALARLSAESGAE